MNTTIVNSNFTYKAYNCHKKDGSSSLPKKSDTELMPPPTPEQTKTILAKRAQTEAADNLSLFCNEILD